MLAVKMISQSTLKLLLMSILSFFTLFVSVCSQADELPHVLFLSFLCPHITPLSPGDPYILKNTGGSITGLGIEVANGKRVPDPMFTGLALSGIPLDLETGHYNRSSTDYNPLDGLITCNYTSTGTFPPFSVVYLPAKGEGGSVNYKTEKIISIRLLFGLANQSA